MPLLGLGTPSTKNIMFNSGILTVEGYEFSVTLKDITVELNFTQKELRGLNSIKMVTHKRATFKCGLKGKITSISRQFLDIFGGISSSDSGGLLYSIVDGQQQTFNPVFTAYVNDDTNQVYQYQFTNAIITQLPTTTNTEDYGMIDFALEATDVNIYESGVSL